MNVLSLYRSATHPLHWFAYTLASGWVVFPARQNGWEERRAARGLDPLHLRQVPLRMAFGTGLLEEAGSACLFPPV